MNVKTKVTNIVQVGISMLKGAAKSAAFHYKLIQL